MKRDGFDKMEETYSNIFKRLGLDFRVVEADSGAIGGSGSKEFMALADSGEDTIVICENCDYGANIEAAIRKAPKEPENRLQVEFKKTLTKDIKTIEDLRAIFYIKSSSKKSSL